MSAFECTETRYGFTWGPLSVSREASHEHAGVVIALETEKERVEIRVTPKGFIRLGTVSTKQKPGPLPGGEKEPIE